MTWFSYRGRYQSQKTLQDWDAPLPEREDDRLESLYAWERRLRGYDLYPKPVALEPAFVPYEPDLDADTGGWQSVPQPLNGYQEEGQSCLRMRLPVDLKVTPAQSTELLTGLRGLTRPVALEIIATERAIHYQIAVSPSDVELCRAAIMYCCPLARISGKGDDDLLLDSLIALDERESAMCAVDFGLYHPAYRPLRLFESFATDPHAMLHVAIGSLKSGEVACLQVIATPARGRWRDSLSRLVAQFDGVTQPAHPNTRDNELERGLRYKLSTPLWAAAVRAFAVASCAPGGKPERMPKRALTLCQDMAEALDAAVQDGCNRLIALDDSGYGAGDQLRDVLDRRVRRTGMLLSTAELAGLWHPPSQSLTHPRLVRYDPKQRLLPDHLRNAPGAVMGVIEPDQVTASGEEPQLVPWPDAMRPRHLYMLGATRMGKSTLLLNLIAQDLLNGRGLCLIDPHGDLARDVLERVPPNRMDDVLYVDLSDQAHPPALGLLETADEWEKGLLVSDLLAVMHRLFSSSWGDRLEHILRHALLTLLAARTSPSGTPLTLRDIRPLLDNKVYRAKLLEQVQDPDLKTFWNTEFSGYQSSAFAPIYNKLSLLLSSPVVRNIIGGAENRLQAGDLIKDRRVLLVNLAQSIIGEDNAHFLGALLVSRIQLAAMHNLRLGRGDRMPFTLYVDEFQNFVVSSFEKILSEAGKAGLTLVMANQFLEQLDIGLATAIRSNAGTLVSFRVSAQSGRSLEAEFGGLYGAGVLTNLECGQAVARIGRAGDSILIRTFLPVEPGTMGALSGTAAIVRKATHHRVCRPRQEVEAELRTADEAMQTMLLAEARAAEQAREAKVRDKKAREEQAREAKAAERKRKSNEATAAPAGKPDVPSGPVKGEPKPPRQRAVAEHAVAATVDKQEEDPSITPASEESDAINEPAGVTPFFGLPDDQIDESPADPSAG